MIVEILYGTGYLVNWFRLSADKLNETTARLYERVTKFGITNIKYRFNIATDNIKFILGTLF
jgi:hypothetical protein